MKKRWLILMSAMTLIAVAGLFAKEPSFECDWNTIDRADVAANHCYNLRADDDPWSLILLRRNGRSKECDKYNVAEFHSHGYYLCHVDGIWLQSCIW